MKYKYTRKQIIDEIRNGFGSSGLGKVTGRAIEMLKAKKKWVPPVGSYYYYVDISIEDDRSEGRESERDRLKHNLIFPYTPEGKKAAIKRAKEMLGIKN